MYAPEAVFAALLLLSPIFGYCENTKELTMLFMVSKVALAYSIAEFATSQNMRHQ
jgi:hypothetical protein